MASKVFADANVLLDFTLRRENAYETARRILEFGVDGRVQLVTTPAVLHICDYYLKQVYKEKTRKIILTLLNDLYIIDCDHSTALNAANSSIDDLEDALQYFTALKHQADYFISNDKKLKREALPQLPVYTPKELLAELATS